MRIQSVFWLVLLNSFCLNNLPAHDDSPEEKPSKARLALELEHQVQRANLLKERVGLLKSLQAVQVESSRLQVASLKVEQETLAAKMAESDAMLQFVRANFERTKQLRKRNAVAEPELERAKQQLTHAEMEKRQLASASEQLKVNIAKQEVALKHEQIEGALRVSEAKLEVLEAEFHVKELQIELKHHRE